MRFRENIPYNFNCINYHKDPRHRNCSRKFKWLGLVHYGRHKWYENTAGIQTFPESWSMTKEQMDELEETPLVMAKVFLSVRKTFKPAHIRPHVNRLKKTKRTYIPEITSPSHNQN